MNIMVAVDLGNEAEAVLQRALPWAARLSATIRGAVRARVPDARSPGRCPVTQVAAMKEAMAS